MLFLIKNNIDVVGIHLSYNEKYIFMYKKTFVVIIHLLV